MHSIDFQLKFHHFLSYGYLFDDSGRGAMQGWHRVRLSERFEFRERIVAWKGSYSGNSLKHRLWAWAR